MRSPQTSQTYPRLAKLTRIQVERVVTNCGQEAYGHVSRVLSVAAGKHIAQKLVRLPGAWLAVGGGESGNGSGDPPPAAVRRGQTP
jgi:hypothetical protein